MEKVKMFNGKMLEIGDKIYFADLWQSDDGDEEELLDSGCVVWKCKCDCGNIKEVLADELKKGLVKSCGCLRDEKRKLNGKKYQKYRKNI